MENTTMAKRIKRSRVPDASEAPVARRPTHEEIAREAYAIYQANGSRDGFAESDWFEAERLLTSRYENLPRHGDATDQHGGGQIGQHSRVESSEPDEAALAG